MNPTVTANATSVTANEKRIRVASVRRGASGDVDGATVAPHPHPTERDLARQIRCWIAFDAIETGRAALRTSRQHFRERKPFRVSRDGVLERVYFE